MFIRCAEALSKQIKNHTCSEHMKRLCEKTRARTHTIWLHRKNISIKNAIKGENSHWEQPTHFQIFFKHSFVVEQLVIFLPDFLARATLQFTYFPLVQQTFRLAADSSNKTHSPLYRLQTDQNVLRICWPRVGYCPWRVWMSIYKAGRTDMQADTKLVFIANSHRPTRRNSTVECCVVSEGVNKLLR